MIFTKKKDSGMRLNKKSNLIGLGAVIFVVGIIVGVLINDIPMISFETKIDASAIIATIGLIATIFIMPFIVDARKDNLAGTKSMAIVDLDTLCGYIDELRTIYKTLLLNKQVLTKETYSIIISTFQQISSLISTLSDEFARRKILPNFKEIIKADLYLATYESCTEKLVVGQKLSEKEIQASLVELNKLFSKIKEFRYEIYNQ